MNRIAFEALRSLPAKCAGSRATGWPPWYIHSMSRSADTPGLHVPDLAACYVGAVDSRHFEGHHDEDESRPTLSITAKRISAVRFSQAYEAFHRQIQEELRILKKTDELPTFEDVLGTMKS